MVELNGTSDGPPSFLLHVDYLIIGTGPAGGALAAFMASYGKGKQKLGLCVFS